MVPVGIVSIGYPPVPHVSGFRAHGFAQILHSLRFHVTVITSSGDLQPSVTEEGGITVLRIPHHPSREWSESRRAVDLLPHLLKGSHHDWVNNVLKLAPPYLSPHTVFWGINGGFSAHQIAARLAVELDGRWIADFKDHWAGPSRRMLPTRLDEVVERRRLRSAAALTSASTRGSDYLTALFGRPVTPIYTGFDDSQSTSPEIPGAQPSRFNIVYTGHLSDAMGVELLAEGFRAASELLRDSATLHYYGNEPSRLIEVLRGAGCPEILADHKWVQHNEIRSRQMSADLLLYLPLVQRPIVGVKFLEYLASGRPIVSVPAEADRLFRSYINAEDGVWAADTGPELSDLFDQLITQWKTHGRLPNYARDINKFSWIDQGTILGHIIESL